MEYLNKLKSLGITRTTSGKQKCPNCIASKKDKSALDLSITFQSDRVLYQCHNGCGFNGVVFMNDLRPVQKKTYKRPESPQTKSDKKLLYDYWEKRGISQKTVDKFGIQTNDKKIKINDKWHVVNQMIFPYYKNGELVNHKYRWTDPESKKKRFMQDAEAEQVLYGMDLITDFSRLIFVEGEPDVLTLAELGIEAVSVSQGAEDNKLDCIENCYEWLQQFDKYIICVDNDKPYTEEQIKKDPRLKDKILAGDNLRKNLLNRLKKTKCKVAKYELEGNDGIISYKDANEVLTQCSYAEDFLKVIIEEAKPVPVDNIVTFNDISHELEDFYYNGFSRGVSTGWTNLDRLISIHTGYMMVVTGRPSSGKSLLIKNLLYNLSINNGWKHLYFDDESHLKVTFANLAMMYHNKHFYGYDKMSISDVQEAQKFLSEHFLFLPRLNDWNIDTILEKTEECVERYGVKTLTIDPFNKLKHNTSDKNMLQYIQEFLQKCTYAARKYDILLTVVAHPTKPNYQKGEIDLYDISGSADWVNMTDYGLIASRTKKDNVWSRETKIVVEKVKDEHMGNTSGGNAVLTKGIGRFEDKETNTTKPIYEQKRMFNNGE